jgi:hypothetical protein
VLQVSLPPLAAASATIDATLECETAIPKTAPVTARLIAAAVTRKMKFSVLIFTDTSIHHDREYSIPRPIDVTVITRVLDLSFGSDDDRFETRKSRKFVIAVTAAGGGISPSARIPKHHLGQ